MGSFHTVVAMVPCPRCGDRHYLSHQTKFFDSDYPRHDLRVGGSFEAWETLADLEADPVWEGEWMRISDGPLDPRRVVVFDETASCGCGAGLAMLLVYTGCGCGVGSMMCLLTYEPDETGYRRVRIERRHVDGVADLEDTHFVFAPAAIGRPHERSWVEHGLVAVSTRLRL